MSEAAVGSQATRFLLRACGLPYGTEVFNAEPRALIIKGTRMRFARHTACAIALTASLSLPVLAQGTGSSTTSGLSTATGSSADSSLRDNDRGFDWGLLGLLGLAGLVGLRKQPDVTRTDATRASMQR